MTAAQFTAALQSLDLSVDAFAGRSGVHRTTVYRWLREDSLPPWAAWIACLMMERQRIRDMLREKP